MIDAPATQRSGNFLTTLPGILTAAAAVVTAVGGLYLGFRGDGSGSDRAHASGTSGPTNTAVPPVPTQRVEASQVNLGDLSGVDTSDLGSDVDRAIDDCANGSGDACLLLLDLLTVECDTGYGLSCDVLYLVSPAGSDYEAFGNTCGGRFPEPYPGWCADL